MSWLVSVLWVGEWCGSSVMAARAVATTSHVAAPRPTRQCDRYSNREPPWNNRAMSIIEVTISESAIRLGPFLKLAGLAMGAPDAKVMIEKGWVRVNGQVE